MAITFPTLESIIWYRRLTVDNSTTFQLFHNNHDLRSQGQRIIQNGRVLWLLPTLPSDSGMYTYVFRYARGGGGGGELIYTYKSNSYTTKLFKQGITQHVVIIIISKMKSYY